jgi:hypothetical protein
MDLDVAGIVIQKNFTHCREIIMLRRNVHSDFEQADGAVRGLRTQQFQR